MIVHCATGNTGKLCEFQRAVEHFGATGIAIEPLPGLADIAQPEETGATFEENAILKAVYYSRFSSHPVFADDSGLAVDALGGAPGVLSARYSGPGATDATNNALVLDRMRGRNDRAARFVCVIALARRGEILGTFRGVVEGVLLEEARGEGGFGYDPLFYYPPFGCTLAQATATAKMQVSHRGQALEKLLRYLATYTE
ncbi:MAG: RdgB/HAM1 family non-canonical purine NTP pyrophosphatase [Bryobacteraceae bacterium]